ncbi:acyl-CoA desaturase [Penicillium malachiteum]|nr:acyl-CoA desaturase [Penicillium malachiteum]
MIASSQNSTFVTAKDRLGLPNRFKQLSGKIHWPKLWILVIIPLCALLQVPFVTLHSKTLVLSVAYYFLTGLSITGGYHRLWAHRSFSASTPIKVLFAAFGAGAVEGTILKWSKDHRAHHRYTDTAQDPYGVQNGIFHAHILWLIIRQPKKDARVDVSDLQNDPIVVWQQKYYLSLMLVMALCVPSAIAGIWWHDWYGGFLYAGVLRYFLVNQATFCVNSLAHWLGDQPYGDQHSPCNHIMTAFITFGEGYHNFHHEFPADYRCGINWYDYDPTKWLISWLAWLGVVTQLKRFRSNEIFKRRIQRKRSILAGESARLDWGPPLSQLPTMTWGDYQCAIQDGHAYLAIEGIVHDISTLLTDHPGGSKLLRLNLGKDVTSSFNGGVYNHSEVARNLLSTMRIAVLKGGGKVEILKEKTGYE